MPTLRWPDWVGIRKTDRATQQARIYSALSQAYGMPTPSNTTDTAQRRILSQAALTARSNRARTAHAQAETSAHDANVYVQQFSTIPPWRVPTDEDESPQCQPCDPAPPVRETPATTRRRIKGIGVELEGGWRSRPPTPIHGDASVRVTADYVGEVCSPGRGHPTIADAVQWTRDNYPQYVNASCGLHVHVSINELNYGRLMDHDFEAYYNERLAAFIQDGLNRGAAGYDLLRSRFAGENRYCQKKFIPEQQLFEPRRYGPPEEHPRYCQLNFCYGRHGTVECRVFPCFPDVEEGVKAVELFYDIVHSYLGRFRSTTDEAVSLTINLKD